MSFARRYVRSPTSLGFLAAAGTILGGCWSSSPPEDSVAGTRLALTTTAVSFQDGSNGYAGTTDTQIVQNAATTKYGTATTLLADGDEPTRSGRDAYLLLRWDLSSIPADATVSVVSLTFRVTDASTGSYYLYALNRNWAESTATWNLASSSVAWQTAGARGSVDRNPTAIGTFTAKSTGTVTLSLTAYGVSLVSGWIVDPSKNYGFILADTSNSDSLRIASSEYATVSYRPKITVTYSTNGGTGGTGGTSTGGTGTGGASTGGTGGTETGGTETGGVATGGTETGGTEAGGVATGGTETGGVATGGTETGGVATGGTETGGVATGGTETGGTGTGGTTGTAGTGPFGFFVWSDAQVSSSTSSLQTAVAQMSAIDSTAIAAFSLGDFANNDNMTQWNYHIGFVSTLFDPAATDFGPRPRYLGALGNHDVMATYPAGYWYTLWTGHLPGQTGLGHSGTDGVYYSLTHQNALFVVMDSEHVSGTSYLDPQTTALASALAGSTAQFKFVFFHEPVYSCNTLHAGFAKGLPWIDLAEKNNVDVVFSGHTHVYTRTCRMLRGQCTTGPTGTVQVETGTVGSTGRTVDVGTAKVTGTDSTGAARTDTYNCTTNLVKSKGSTTDFCYVRIDGSVATISCYVVGNTTPFDSWQITHG